MLLFHHRSARAALVTALVVVTSGCPRPGRFLSNDPTAAPSRRHTVALVAPGAAASAPHVTIHTRDFATIMPATPAPGPVILRFRRVKQRAAWPNANNQAKTPH